MPAGLSGNDYFLRVETHINGIPYGIGYSGTFSIVAASVSTLSYAKISLPSVTLFNGSNILYRFKATASTADAVISSLKFYLSQSGVAIDKVELGIYSDSNFSSQIQPTLSLVAPIGSTETLVEFKPGDVVIPAGTTKYFELRGTVRITGFSPTVTVTARFNDLTTNVLTGTGISGALSVSLDASTPASHTVPGGSRDVVATVLKFAASGETISLQQIGLQSDGSNPAALVKSTIWDGLVKIGEAVFVGTARTSSVVLVSPVTIPANGEKAVVIKVDLSPVGIGQPAQVGDTVAINYDGDNSLATKGVGLSSAKVIYSGTKIDTAAPKIILGSPSLSSITVISPNGGETFVQGVNTNKISWSGGTCPETNKYCIGVSLWDVTKTKRYGWITGSGAPNNAAYWDAKGVFSLRGGGNSIAVSPGTYRIKVEDSVTSDWSDSSFSIVAGVTSCVSCAAPPQGCRYDGASCQSCGTLVCESLLP